MKKGMRYFDSHAHIASSHHAYANIDAVIKCAREAGLIKVADAAIDIETSKAVLDLYAKYPDFVIPTVGLHPELLISGSDIYSKDLNIDLELENLKKLYLKNEGKYKAVGECGLDYYWIDRSKELTKNEKIRVKSLEATLFQAQIDLASEVNLPLIVHSRGAEEESLRIINEKLRIKNSKVGVLFHCYTGNINVAQKVFEAGYYLSFNGILTYPNAGNVREIFKLGWSKFREQVLTETDAPLLAPQSKKGEVCEPSDVVYVVKEMASIVDEAVEKVAVQTVKNAKGFYSI